ncbi:PREDICTED: alcohol dehydrogenase 1-like [Lupinus angustifolius]|nr:PREDICTED: alcohol dehydrogenase 1-like [Lupinus angustifolius]
MAFAAIVRRKFTTHFKLPSLCFTNQLFSLNSQTQQQLFSFHTESVGSGGDGLPSYMRGAVFWEPNKPLTIEEFRMPRPKAGEVLIKTKACGVCHSDLHVMKGEIPFSSPCVVGHEITGEIVEHGPLSDPKTIERLPLGSRVVGAFIMPCGNCSYCSKGHDDLCEPFFAYNRAKGTLYDGETRLFLRSNG